jgi:hypothetical protein
MNIRLLAESYEEISDPKRLIEEIFRIRSSPAGTTVVSGVMAAGVGGM